jgi:tellurite resistance protein TehA-like permease
MRRAADAVAAAVICHIFLFGLLDFLGTWFHAIAQGRTIIMSYA